MSYSGSVYCGYCGIRGHNKLGCSKRKEYAEKNPNCYVGMQLEREKATRKRAIASRACSYCRERGHNRRGCSQLKEDKRTLLSDVKDYRHKFLESMKKAGLGIGALVLAPHSCARENWKVLYMITEINWDVIDFQMGEDQANGYQHNVFDTRIAHTPPHETYENPTYYDKPPSANDRYCLPSVYLAGELKDVLHVPELLYANHAIGKIPYERLEGKVVSRSEFIKPPAGWLNPTELYHRLAEEWNIYPRHSASNWDKEKKWQMWDQRNTKKEGIESEN